MCRIAPSRRAALPHRKDRIHFYLRGRTRRGNATYCAPSLNLHRDIFEQKQLLVSYQCLFVLLPSLLSLSLSLSPLPLSLVFFPTFPSFFLPFLSFLFLCRCYLFITLLCPISPSLPLSLPSSLPPYLPTSVVQPQPRFAERGAVFREKWRV